MKNKMYVIRDRKSNLYGTPFVSHNDNCAKREFNAFCKMSNNAYLAEDCELYYVGEIDNESGIIEAPEKPVFLMNFCPEV